MNLPNKITLTRIFMIPVFVVLFYVEFPYHELVSAIVFVLAASTDFLDGYIARKYHLVTDLGKFLDPIADKVLVSTALILMLTRPSVFLLFGEISWGLMVAGIAVAIILARELIVSGFRMVAAGKNLVLAADKLGKYKTATTDAAIALLLACMSFAGETGAVYPAAVGLALFGIATLLTIASGVNYIVRNRSVLIDKKEPEGQSSEEQK